MSETNGSKWLAYVGRFTLVHVFAYTLMAAIILLIQRALPQPTQAALETLGPYRPVGAITTSGQILRAIFLALVLYPFYDTLVNGKRGWLILFGALWGVVRVGSVDPMPGSIEGFIYTETPLLGHIVALAAGTLEVSFFSLLFLRWERSSQMTSNHKKEEVVQHG